MKRILKYSGLALLVLLVAGAIAFFTVDFGFLKHRIETQASRSSGLEIVIEGPLSVRLGGDVRIEARQLRISNPAWPGETRIATLGRVALRAGWPGLLGETLTLAELELDDLDLALALNDEARGNWQGAAAGEESAVAPPRIDALKMLRVGGRFESPQLDGPLRFEFDQVSQTLDASASMHLQAQGRFNDRDLSVALTGGPWDHLFQGGSASFTLDGRLGGTRLDGEARFQDLWRPTRPVIELRLAGPSLRELADMFSVSGLGDGPVDLAIVSSDESGHLAYSARGSAGELSLDISGQAESLGSLAESSLQAHVKGPNFGRLARLAGYPGWLEGPFSIDTQLANSGGALTISRFDLTVAEANLSLVGTLPEFPALDLASLDLNARGRDLALLRKPLGLDKAPEGPFSVRGAVQYTTGRTELDILFETEPVLGTISGQVGTGDFLEGSDLELVLSGQNAARVGALLDIGGLPDTPWSLGASVSIPDRLAYHVSGVNIRNSGLTVKANGAIGREAFDDRTSLDLEIHGASLAGFQAYAGDQLLLPDLPFSVTGKISAASGRWHYTAMKLAVGDEMLTVDGSLQGDGLRFDLSGHDIIDYFPGLSGLRPPDAALTASGSLSMQPGRIRLAGLRADSGPFHAEGELDIPWPPDAGSGRFNLAAEGQDVRRVLPQIGSLELAALPFSGRFDGDWSSEQFEFRAASLRLGDTEFSLTGTFDRPPNLSATDLEIVVTSPDAAALGTFDGAQWDPVAVHLRAAFSGDTHRISMHRFEGQVGPNFIDGRFMLDFSQATPQFELSLNTPSLDLTPFQAEPESGPAAKPDPGARLIPDLAFPMALLSRANGRFDLQAQHIVMRNMRLSGNVLRGTVQDGALQITQASTDGYRGRLLGTLTLSPDAAATARLNATLVSDRLVFNLSRQTSQQKDLLPAFTIDIALDGRGPGLRQAAASLNGRIRVDSTGGEVPNVESDSAAALFLSEVIAAISPSEARKDVIQVSCFATVAGIEKGVVLLDPGMALQSDRLNIFATGRIELADEKIDLRFKTETRKAISLSAGELVSPYVKLSGTLADPSVALDAKGTLLSGGAAYLSGGLSILAKKALDSMVGSKDPCAGHLAEAIGNG